MVQASGAVSIADLAGLLGRPADGLYYHVRALLKVGLLLEHGDRPVRNGRGRTEVLYAVPGRLQLKYEPKNPANVAGIKRAARAMLRITGRTFEQAFDSGLAIGSGPNRNIVSGRMKGWLTPDQVAQVNALIERIGGVLAAGRRTSASRPYAVTYVLTPLATRPARRQPRTKGGRR